MTEDTAQAIGRLLAAALVSGLVAGLFGLGAFLLLRGQS